MFNLGMSEIVVILVVALVFLGPKKLPELASGIGKMIRELRKATADIKSEIELDETIRGPLEELREATMLPPEELKRRDVERAERLVREREERQERERAQIDKTAGEEAAEAAQTPPASNSDKTIAMPSPFASETPATPAPAAHPTGAVPRGTMMGMAPPAGLKSDPGADPQPPRGRPQSPPLVAPPPPPPPPAFATAGKLPRPPAKKA